MLNAYSGREGYYLLPVLVVVCDILVKATSQKRNYKVLAKKMLNKV